MKEIPGFIPHPLARVFPPFWHDLDDFFSHEATQFRAKILFTLKSLDLDLASRFPKKSFKCRNRTINRAKNTRKFCPNLRTVFHAQKFSLSTRVSSPVGNRPNDCESRRAFQHFTMILPFKMCCGSAFYEASAPSWVGTAMR